ncbi:MAG: adenylosuccinate lyase [Anaerolineae bacterium]
MPPLTALSPLDGRYRRQVAALADTFSELALLKTRLHVEVEWFIALSACPGIPELRPVTSVEAGLLRGLARNFNRAEAETVKAIERETNHDVKAVECYLKQKLNDTSLRGAREFVHFACTSADINNLAHALMLKRGMEQVWLPAARQTIAAIDGLAQRYRALPMLAHTHGQPASPTTLGKEMAVFSHRLRRQAAQVQNQPYMGKLSGAVGNFNAHLAAYPTLDWPHFAQTFVEQTLGLTFNPLTTQIEPHDYMAELFQTVARFNTIIIDFARDVWLYISKGYFTQPPAPQEVGSSTMPHKINPIDFENAEGNMALSNALLNFMACKLPLSRWQRDLSDSTVIRNTGVALGHSLLALKSVVRGTGKLAADETRLHADLAAHWEVLAEAVQTVMRKAGLDAPYEQLKTLSRGQPVSRATLTAFIRQLPIKEADKRRLLALTPDTYLGCAAALVPGDPLR